MLFAFWLLWRMRGHQHATGWLFGVYLILAGLERFAIEFVRAKDDRFLGPFTVAQLVSVAIVTIGAVLMARWRRDDGFVLPPEAKRVFATSREGSSTAEAPAGR
jgi:phosphatidylglycerol:prolipoprotein diacylglycerol transferase